MKEPYKIPLSKVVEDHHLEVIVRPEHFDQIQITSPEVNRPGLALAGFYEIFEPERIQLIGKAETQYLNSLDASAKRLRLQQLVDAEPVAILYTTNLPVDEAIIQRAKQKGVPILRTEAKTSPIMASLISSLNTHLAPRITRHGGLVEVYGEGLLLLGDSGIGKSETAIELIKRGHRLIADDAVEIKRVSDRTLIGSAPEIIRHYVELRGIGIVDVRRLFGMGAVKLQQEIDMIIKLEPWDATKTYDRMGVDEQYANILGVKIPSMTIPVKPGRNTAVIMEVAAMNSRQKKMGYNATEELLHNLGLESMPGQEIITDFDQF